MPRTKKTPEQKIAALEARVNVLSKTIEVLWDQKKEIALAQGSIRDKIARIEYLEKRLASQIERNADLDDRIGKISVLEDSNKSLHERIVHLNAELEAVMKSRGEIQSELTQVIRKKDIAIIGHETRLARLCTATQNLMDENDALRKTLKKVL